MVDYSTIWPRKKKHFSLDTSQHCPVVAQCLAILAWQGDGGGGREKRKRKEGSSLCFSESSAAPAALPFVHPKLHYAQHSPTMSHDIATFTSCNVLMLLAVILI